MKMTKLLALLLALLMALSLVACGDSGSKKKDKDDDDDKKTSDVDKDDDKKPSDDDDEKKEPGDKDDNKKDPSTGTNELTDQEKIVGKWAGEINALPILGIPRIDEYVDFAVPIYMEFTDDGNMKMYAEKDEFEAALAQATKIFPAAIRKWYDEALPDLLDEYGMTEEDFGYSKEEYVEELLDELSDIDLDYFTDEGAYSMSDGKIALIGDDIDDGSYGLYQFSGGSKLTISKYYSNGFEVENGLFPLSLTKIL